MQFFIFASLVLFASAHDDLYEASGYGSSGESLGDEQMMRPLETIPLETDEQTTYRRRRQVAEATDEPSTTATPLNSTTTVAAGNKTCAAASICETNDDCNGGACLGFFPGKCNCNGCLFFLPCQSDSECGGLEGACNNSTKLCDCIGALAKHGFPTFIDALQNFCNVKSCKTDECKGLSCNKGFCACPKKKD